MKVDWSAVALVLGLAIAAVLAGIFVKDGGAELAALLAGLAAGMVPRKGALGRP